MKRKEVMKRSRKVLSAVIAASVLASSAVPETLLAADFSDSEVSVETDEQDLSVEDEQDLSEDAGVDLEGEADEEEELNEETSEADEDAPDFADDVSEFSDGQEDTGIALYANNQADTVDSGLCEEIKIASSSLNGNAIWGATEAQQGITMDDSAYLFTSSRYKDGGLPQDGKLTMGSGVTYQLASGSDASRAYDGNDCIRLTAENQSQTMNLLTLGAYDKIYVLATAGGPGSGHYADFKVSLGYTDGTTTETTYKLYDWYDTRYVENVEKYYGIRRYDLNSNQLDSNSSSTGAPVLHSAAIDVDETRLIKSITFTMNGKDGNSSDMNGLYCSIFAVTGKIVDGAPARPETTAPDYDETGTYFTANWNEVSGATGYYLDVSEYPDFVDKDGNPSFVEISNSQGSVYNNKFVDTNSCRINGVSLKDGCYYYRVRATNDKGQSGSSDVREVILHKHVWQYSVDEENSNTIIASCIGKGNCNINKRPLKLKLSASDAVYTGHEYSGAKVTDNISPVVTTVEVGPVNYTGRDGTNYESSTTPPVNAGTYTASITVSGVTVTQNFEIAKAKRTFQLEMNSYTWGETVSIPLIAGFADSSKVTYYYRKYMSWGESEAGKEWKNITSTTLEPGKYEIYTTIPGDDNYTESSVSTQFFVREMQMPEITVNSVTETYDGNPHGVTVTGDLPEGAEIVCIYRKSGSWDESGETDAPVSAGTYNVRVEITAPYYATYDKDAEVIIKPKAVELSWDNTSLTYNGKDQVPTATVTNLVSNDQCEVEVSGAATNAGNDYKATASALYGDASENYTLTDVTNTEQNYTIAPKEITVTPDDASKQYGEDDPEFAYKTSGLEDGDTLTGITLTREKGDNAGNYEITASQNEGANPNYSITFKTGTFTIEKAPAAELPEEEAPKVNANTSYTGKGQALISVGKVTHGTLMYSVNGGKWTTEVPTATNAGTYKISYKVAGDDNHADSEVTELTVTVAPKAVTVTPNNVSKKYGEKDLELTYETNGLADGDKLTGITLTRKEGENAGEYEITASQSEGANPNYSVTFGKGTFTINKAASVELTKENEPTVKANAVYTGAEQPLLSAGTVTGGTLMYQVNGGEWSKEIPAAKNAGIYKISYKVVGDANHEDSDVKELTVAIAPKAVTVIPDNASKTYGENDPEAFTYKEEGLVDGDTLVSITLSRAEGEEAGDYEITASQSEEANPNYSITFKTGTFTIEKAPAAELPEEEAPKVNANTSYTGKGQALISVGKVTHGTLMYSVNGGKWTTEVPTATNAGTYKISYKVVGDANHADSEVTEITVTVAPKAVTVTADNAEKYSGKADPKLTYHAEGLTGNDTLSDIIISRKAGEKVGNYEITVSQKQGANPNYSITFKNAVFTIKQGDQSKLNANAVSKLNLPILLARGAGANKAVNLKWLKYSGAAGYEVYWSYCDGKQNYKKLATLTNGKLTATHRKLNKKREYKYFVVAYKMVDGNKIYIAKSNTLHVAMKQSKKTNAKSVSVNKQNVVLRQGKTFRIKASVKLENKKKKQLSHAAAFRYYVVDSRVATVSKNGTIKAAGRGTTNVYVITNNGVFKTVKVTVK